MQFDFASWTETACLALDFGGIRKTQTASWRFGFCRILVRIKATDRTVRQIVSLSEALYRISNALRVRQPRSEFQRCVLPVVIPFRCRIRAYRRRCDSRFYTRQKRQNTQQRQLDFASDGITHCESTNLSRCILSGRRAIVPFIELNYLSILQCL